MATTQSLPVSEIIRQKDTLITETTGEAVDQKKSREDWRKAKELEEARKAGTAPAAVDEEGKDINPHIPQYISAAPWYFGAAGPTLRHQRPQPEKQKEFSRIEEWYSRGVDVKKIATKFRKGACENCGAVTHKKKDCLERPRKVGAKYTGASIAPDEFHQPNLALDFEGKRDRWNGYDPSEHGAIVEEFQKVEEAKRHIKAERLQKGGIGDGIGGDSESDGEEDEDKYVEEADMPGTKVDSKQRITVRNLRIREDTAKYLRNLDPNSAYYDPKTRSMRDNPYEETGKTPTEVDYAGENFVRFTGDTMKHSSAQLFAWEAYEKGVDVNLQAEPTKLELLKRQFSVEKDSAKGNLQQSILDRYGGEEHLDVPPKTLLLAQTEDYVEYSRHGKVIKGEEKKRISSRYEEDVYLNNHNSVWGSYWRDGVWGYHCCHSFVKNSYCTGSSGREASSGIIPTDMATVQEEEEVESEEEEDPKTLMEIHLEKLREKRRKKKRKGKKGKKRESSSGSSSEEDSPATKKQKLKKALEEEDEQEKSLGKMSDDRLRGYNSRYEVKAPTEEEMEAFLMRRQRDMDPMAQFK